MPTETYMVPSDRYIEVHEGACFARVVGAGSVAVEMSDTQPECSAVPSDTILDGSPLTYKGSAKVWMKSRNEGPTQVKVVFQ